MKNSEALLPSASMIVGSPSKQNWPSKLTLIISSVVALIAEKSAITLSPTVMLVTFSEVAGVSEPPSIVITASIAALIQLASSASAMKPTGIFNTYSPALVNSPLYSADTEKRTTYSLLPSAASRTSTSRLVGPHLSFNVAQPAPSAKATGRSKVMSIVEIDSTVAAPSTISTSPTLAPTTGRDEGSGCSGSSTTGATA